MPCSYCHVLTTASAQTVVGLNNSVAVPSICMAAGLQITTFFYFAVLINASHTRKVQGQQVAGRSHDFCIVIAPHKSHSDPPVLQDRSNLQDIVKECYVEITHNQVCYSAYCTSGSVRTLHLWGTVSAWSEV